MRNRNILYTLMLLITTNIEIAFCQSWSTTGNSGTTPGTNFVGTTDNADLVVKTNNSEKVRVVTGGNVGIGLTAPQNLLHIDGGSNAAYSQYTTTATGNSGSNTSGLIVGVNANGDAILKSNFSSASYGDMNFYTGGTLRMTIIGNTTGSKEGFVGVGTSSPTYKFDCKDAGTCSFRVQSTTAGSANNILSRF